MRNCWLWISEVPSWWNPILSHPRFQGKNGIFWWLWQWKISWHRGNKIVGDLEQNRLHFFVDRHNAWLRQDLEWKAGQFFTGDARIKTDDHIHSDLITIPIGDHHFTDGHKKVCPHIEPDSSQSWINFHFVPNRHHLRKCVPDELPQEATQRQQMILFCTMMSILWFNQKEKTFLTNKGIILKYFAYLDRWADQSICLG